MLPVHKKFHELQVALREATWGFEDPKVEARTFREVRSMFRELTQACGTDWPVAGGLVDRAWAELSADEQAGLPKQRVEAAIGWLKQAHANMHNFDPHVLDEVPRRDFIT